VGKLEDKRKPGRGDTPGGFLSYDTVLFIEFAEVQFRSSMHNDEINYEVSNHCNSRNSPSSFSLKDLRASQVLKR